MLLFCVFIYRFICTRVFKCILMYIKPTKYETKFVRLLFRFTFQNCNLYSWEVFIFCFFKCIFYLLLENWKMSSKLQKNNKMAKTTFSSFFLCVEYEKNKFAMFSVSLYAFYDLMCYRWLKICYKEPCELMFIYILWFTMLYI